MVIHTVNQKLFAVCSQILAITKIPHAEPEDKKGINMQWTPIYQPQPLLQRPEHKIREENDLVSVFSEGLIKGNVFQLMYDSSTLLIKKHETVLSDFFAQIS